MFMIIFMRLKTPIPTVDLTKYTKELLNAEETELFGGTKALTQYTGKEFREYPLQVNLIP